MNNHNNEMQYMNYDIQIQITFFKYKMTLGLSINEKDQVLKSKLQTQYVQLQISNAAQIQLTLSCVGGAVDGFKMA